MNKLIFLAFYFTIISCQQKTGKENMNMEVKDTFASDMEFLKSDSMLLILSKDKMKVAVSSKYQGRVFTSSAAGMDGFSYGWINYDLINSGLKDEHFNAYGGEERFWVGPEGGQFSVFFKKGDSFEMVNWHTPAPIDTEPYNLLENSDSHAVFQKEFDLQNYSGTHFKVNFKREISLLAKAEVENTLGISVNETPYVAYQTTNSLVNTGEEDWNKQTGVLSVWLLGMMKGSEDNTIIIPFKKGKEELINDSYFGKIPKERLIMQNGLLFFKADAKSRGKLGIPPEALIPLAGSYDSKNGFLTLIQIEHSEETDYVNSMWEIQKFPYKGDVINAYNDGPNDLGKQMGQFYELESSSPAVALKKGQILTHIQRTYHFEGSTDQLNGICKSIFGIDLKDIPKL